MKPEVRYIYPDGTVEELDIPNLKGRQLHDFKGWLCTIGRNTLYIDFDGIVWRGTCQQGKALGDIYNGWTKNKSVIECHKKWCNCGADIKQPKFKPTPEGTHKIYPIPAGEQFVIWDLGRYCNFDCSYCCPIKVHNLTDPHKDIEVMKRAVDMSIEHFNGKPNIRFSYAGGEPTMHPDIIELCRYVKEKGHINHLVTNGSRGRRFWEEIVPYLDSISISVHFEFLSMDRLERNINTILDAGGNLELKLMASDMDKVQKALDRLHGYLDRVEIAVAPLMDKKKYIPVEYDSSARFGYVDENTE